MCNFDYHNSIILSLINLILRNPLGIWNVIVNQGVVGYGYRRILYIYFIIVGEIRVVLEFVQGTNI